MENEVEVGTALIISDLMTTITVESVQVILYRCCPRDFSRIALKKGASHQILRAYALPRRVRTRNHRNGPSE